MKNNPNTKVVVSWRSIGEEPSPLWRTLWMRLLQKKGEDKPASTRKEGGDGKMTNENDANISQDDVGV